MKLSYSEVEETARAYLGKSFDPRRGLHVLDIADTDIIEWFFGRHAHSDCWVVYIADHTISCAAAPSRVLCILKQTGEIVYDGSDDVA